MFDDLHDLALGILLAGSPDHLSAPLAEIVLEFDKVFVEVVDDLMLGIGGPSPCKFEVFILVLSPDNGFVVLSDVVVQPFTVFRIERFLFRIVQKFLIYMVHPRSFTKYDRSSQPFSGVFLLRNRLKKTGLLSSFLPQP